MQSRTRFAHLLLLSLTLLGAAATTDDFESAEEVAEDAADRHQGCCLPFKWHSRMLKTNEKAFSYLKNNRFEFSERRASTPLQLDIFVNHRRPRFEIRSPANGSSFVFWRGHMWLFRSNGLPRHMNAVPPSYKPTGGYAPLFFRCLAPRHGFVKVSESHYRLREPVDSPNGQRFGLATVTDVFVRPGKSGGKEFCHLSGFNVSSSYMNFIQDKGPAIIQDVDSYSTVATTGHGWPDRSLTDRARASLDYYRSLLRSGQIKLNRPHLTHRNKRRVNVAY